MTTLRQFEATSGRETRLADGPPSRSDKDRKRLAIASGSGNQTDASANNQRSGMMMRMGAVMRKAICLLVWLSVGQVSGSYRPQDMNRTLQDLLQHYKISKSDIYDEKPVFPREELKGKMESQMLLMAGVLESYEKLFGHMLKELPTPSPLPATSGDKAGASGPSTTALSAAGDTRSNLIKVLEKIRELKRHSYQEQFKILHELQKLKHIEMDNIKVQGKALWELPWIYEKANSLADNVMRRRRRRRRQTKSRLAA